MESMFPCIPKRDAEKVLNHAYLKGSGRVGRTARHSNEDKVRLAVIAHIRHEWTEYDKLMGEKGLTREEARKRVWRTVANIRDKWMGEGGGGLKMEKRGLASKAPRSRAAAHPKGDGLGGYEDLDEQSLSDEAEDESGDSDLDSVYSTDVDLVSTDGAFESEYESNSGDVRMRTASPLDDSAPSPMSIDSDFEIRPRSSRPLRWSQRAALLRQAGSRKDPLMIE